MSIGGLVTDSYSYKAFGEELAVGSGTANTMRYIGLFQYYRDTARRAQVRAREVDVVDGRWISRDPLGFDTGDWNLYRYVGNNVVNSIDPEGLETEILVVYGGDEGVPLCYQAYYMCAMPNRNLEFPVKYVELYKPTKKQILQALLTADDFYFWGHGGDIFGGIFPNDDHKDKIWPIDVIHLMKMRKNIGKGKFNWIDLHACMTSKTAKDVNQWLQVCNTLYAYPGLTAQGHWPFFSYQECYTHTITKDPGDGSNKGHKNRKKPGSN